MPKLLIEDHGERSYVYSCSSKRVPGVDHPVTSKRYIGTLDRGTGMVSPRRIHLDDISPPIRDGEFRCYNLGGVIVARKAAESLNLPDMLREHFGDDSGLIYAITIALACNSSHSADYVKYMSRLFLDDIPNIGRITTTRIDRVLKNVHRKIFLIEPFNSTSEGHYVFVTDDVFKRFRLGGHIRSGEGLGADISNRMIMIVTDRSGNPLIIRSMNQGIGRTEAYISAMDYAGSMGGDNILVTGNNQSVDTIASLTIRGLPFICRMDNLFDSIWMDSSIHDAGWGEKTRNGKTYKVLERGLNLFHDNRKWGVSCIDKPDTPLKAFIWSEEEDLNNFKELLRTMSNHRKRELLSMDPESAKDHLDDGGFESCFMEVSDDGYGGTKVTIHRKERMVLAYRASSHVFITNTGSWDECMDCMETRRTLTSHIEPFIQASLSFGDRSRYTHSFLSFLAMKVRMELESMARRADMKYRYADDIFDVVSTYTAVRIEDAVYHSSVSDEVDEVFNALGINREQYGGRGSPRDIL